MGNVYGVVYEQMNNSAWEGHSPGKSRRVNPPRVPQYKQADKGQSWESEAIPHTYIRLKFRCKLNIKQPNVNLSRNLGDYIDVYW